MEMILEYSRDDVTLSAALPCSCQKYVFIYMIVLNGTLLFKYLRAAVHMVADRGFFLKKIKSHCPPENSLSQNPSNKVSFGSKGQIDLARQYFQFYPFALSHLLVNDAAMTLNVAVSVPP